MVTLLIFGAIALFIVLLLLGRWLYTRSIQLKNRLQMDHVFTNISHELLTPLTVLSASVEHLRKQEPAYTKDYVMMELNIERMTRLLQEILETSKTQSGELKLLVSQGDVMEYIRRTALCIAPLFQKQGLEFNIQCNPKSMMGWIDTDKVDKIIYNLLSNAAKYTNSPGRIDLNATTSEYFDKVIIEVRDNGIGIPPEKMKRLFHRFYDGDYRRMQVSGIGLGLALSRELADLHGGTITCHSEEGKGSTFTVLLPISKDAFSPSQIDEKRSFGINQLSPIDISILEQAPTVAPKAVVAGTASDDAYRILIVEDNEELLMMMSALLSNRFKVFQATSGLEALDVISNHDLDIVVSDVMMPEMDGNQLTERIKGTPEWNHLPVILLSAKTTEEDRRHSMALGADAYITKPFRLGDLEVCINSIIESHKRINTEQPTTEVAPEERPLTADEEFMQKATECVYAHLSDSDFDRDAFAFDMGTSTSTLYNKLRVLTGMNVSSFIRDIRMKEARRLAELQPDIRISDLAYKVGYKDPKYFATCFKKEFGVQPSEFIEQLNAE